jgi:hypothetical protein
MQRNGSNSIPGWFPVRPDVSNPGYYRVASTASSRCVSKQAQISLGPLAETRKQQCLLLAGLGRRYELITASNY